MKAIGRLPGAEAHGRVQTAKALRELPLVAAAYGAGSILVAHVRAIARVASNPRVAEHLPGGDAIFAHHGAVLAHDDFVSVLRQWEALADADGARQGADESHERRRAGLVRSAINGSWSIDGFVGARNDGPTDCENSDLHCGFHNRLKERGFVPVRDDGRTYTFHRPGGGGPITSSV